MLTALFSLLVRDLVFLLVLAVIVAPLCAAKNATFAVLKRNFVGYFSNPTGYAFLCLFVWLTSFAAFWPHEFFNSNLANLDQLNKFLPFIMLIFVPAITMSIWAEERRQGTDELLLTLPAGDFDIVVGKYLAAGSIFTASLLFSQVCNFFVLAALSLGDLDVGLFFATYVGYWLVGMAMLSIGMVASFLTSNLTVGFILGALFNAPLVFAMYADLASSSSKVSQLISSWSVAAQFDAFGRGVISLSPTVYFAMVIVVGLYLSMVLIGARHWSGGRDGNSLLAHFLVRTLALLAIAFGMNYVFTNNVALSSARVDLTRNNGASLSAETKKLMRGLKDEEKFKHTIFIDAFVSSQVPENYARTKADLISMLKEFQVMAGTNRISLNIHIMDEESIEIAQLAEERYGIVPQSVTTRQGGAIRDDDVYLAAAFTCGLEKVVVPFFDYGIPVEYELARSISTVAQSERKTLGIVRTAAQMMGGFSFAGGQPRNIPKQPIIDELEKQYEVKEIDPSTPIDLESCDVMLVVQPSSLGPEELTNVVDAVRAGQPTAIFEDPRPIYLTSAPGTGDPNPPAGGGMQGMFGGGGGQSPPKGDIRQLWDVLDLEIPGAQGAGMMGPPLFEPDLVWHRYNPYPKMQLRGFPMEFVFCRPSSPEDDKSINPDAEITKGLEEVFFPIPGAVEQARNSDLEFIELVQTSDEAGTIPSSDFMDRQRGDPSAGAKAYNKRGRRQVLAAWIRGVTDSNENKDRPASTEAEESAADEESTTTTAPEDADAEAATTTDTDDANTGEAATEEEAPKDRPINVVYVADIDLMFGAFLSIRARPDEFEDISWQFENVNFLLNVIDTLSGDDQYVKIRRHKPYHATLRMVEVQTQAKKKEEFEQEKEFREKRDKALKEAEEENKKNLKEFEDRVKELEKKQMEAGQRGISQTDLIKAIQDQAERRAVLERKLQIEREKRQRELDESLKVIRREIDSDIRNIKNQFKLLAVTIPPIPPLLIGLIVFTRRRLREREGIARSRMR